jgi:hypothetical protein
MKTWRAAIAVVLLIAGCARIVAQSGEVSRPKAGEPNAGAEALRRAQKATGGLDRLRAVRDLTRSVEMVASATGSKARQTVEIIFPSTIRLTNTVETTEITAFFDGVSGWVKSPWGVDDPLPAWQRSAAQQDLARQLELLLQSGRDGGKTVEYAESCKVGDRAADVVSIPAPEGGNLRLAIDAQTGDPLRLEYRRITPHGPGPLIADFYGDYRKTANGLRMPFHVRTLSDGSLYMETTVVSVEYNRGLRAEALRRRDARLP